MVFLAVRMILVRSIQAYFENFVTSIIFLLLGLFVFLFVVLSDFFLSSGNIFFDYGFFTSFSVVTVLELALVLVCIGFFSVFVSAMVFAVRQDLAKVKFAQYVREKIPRFSMELFEFFVLLFIFELVVGFVFLSLGLPLFAVALVLLPVNALLVFVPQSIVVDELSWDKAVSFNLHFIRTNIGTTLWVWILGMILVGMLPFVELLFDRFDFAGRFVSLFVALLIVIPFFETVKTVAFMTKFGIVKEQVQ